MEDFFGKKTITLSLEDSQIIALESMLVWLHGKAQSKSFVPFFVESKNLEDVLEQLSKQSRQQWGYVADSISNDNK